ncbi:MAG: hypothetical protein RIB98_08135 [Acidimicrobiales bacterium]
MERVDEAEDGRLVHVLRWREALAKIDVFTDESQLSEGFSVWTSQHCRLAIEGVSLAAPITLTDCGPDESDDPLQRGSRTGCDRS